MQSIQTLNAIPMHKLYAIKQLGVFTLPTTHRPLLSQTNVEEPLDHIQPFSPLQQLNSSMTYYNIDV